MEGLLRFVTGPLPGPVLPASYDAGLVVLSYVVASLAAYTAIDLAGRVSEYREKRRRARRCPPAGRSALGAGTWPITSVASSASHCRFPSASGPGPPSPPWAPPFPPP